jgi:hypothetical protein
MSEDLRSPHYANLSAGFVETNGIRVSREVSDLDVVREMQQELMGEFGDAVELFGDPKRVYRVVLLGKLETTRALMATKDQRDGDIGTSMLEQNLEDQLAPSIRTPVVSDTRRVKFLPRTIPNYRGLISARVTDGRHANARGILTSLVDQSTGMQHKWSGLEPLIGLMLLKDESAIKDIHGFRFKSRVNIPLGRMSIN